MVGMTSTSGNREIFIPVIDLEAYNQMATYVSAIAIPCINHKKLKIDKIYVADQADLKLYGEKNTLSYNPTEFSKVADSYSTVAEYMKVIGDKYRGTNPVYIKTFSVSNASTEIDISSYSSIFFKNGDVTGRSETILFGVHII